MIVIVGVPAWRAAHGGATGDPAGRACEVAVAAAARGAQVELVGRTGDDATGDALLLALTRAGVGHAAMLRDPVRATPVLRAEPEAEPADDKTLLGGVLADPDGAPESRTVAPIDGAPRLDPADVSLGLGYLTAFSVLVVTDGVPDSVIPAAAEAAGFAGAHLILLMPAGGVPPASLDAASTVLAAPADADEGAFSSLIAAYAASLDAGAAPADAFALATGEAGWAAL